MKKQHLLISLIPILGWGLHASYIFMKNKSAFNKSWLSCLAGMVSFMIVYGTFGIICNTLALDLTAYMWLVALMFVVSGILWNIVYFLVFHKLTSKKTVDK